MVDARPIDLRLQVLAAVDAGMTHREAAERFGVGTGSVSKWRALVRERGDARPKPAGGDRKSQRIEAQKDRILALLSRDQHLSIEATRQALAAQGLVFGFGTLQRFFKRHNIVRTPRPTPEARKPSRPPGVRALGLTMDEIATELAEVRSC